MTVKTIIRITIQGPMPDTDQEPGVWIADVRIEEEQEKESNNTTANRLLKQQSWKTLDFNGLLYHLPEIVKNLCQPPNPSPP